MKKSKVLLILLLSAYSTVQSAAAAVPDVVSTDLQCTPVDGCPEKERIKLNECPLLSRCQELCKPYGVHFFGFFYYVSAGKFEPYIVGKKVEGKRIKVPLDLTRRVTQELTESDALYAAMRAYYQDLHENVVKQIAKPKQGLFRVGAQGGMDWRMMKP